MSGSVFLSNLDDFIAPSQACVNPLVSGKLDNSVDVGTTTEKSAKVTISNDYSRTEFERAEVKPNLINTKVSSAKKVASISLNDCLACSGCVTSAETVLIQEQSYEKLLDQLSLPAESRPIIIVAISPNSLASISTFLNMDTIECFLRISSVLKQLGVGYVIDASSGGDVALIEAREEFLQRYKEGQRKTWTKPPTTTAFSSTDINVFSHAAQDHTMSAIGTASLQPEVTHKELPELHTQLPVLSSHCPGWVCYAEKSQPQAIPFISTVKSAQQILGSILKSKILPVGDGSKSVYFVSIQPCFDKKLEASRLDFYHTEESCTEVDLVISTTELWRLLEAQITTTNTSDDSTEGQEAVPPPESHATGSGHEQSTEARGVVLGDDGTDDDDGLIRAVVKKAKLCDDDTTTGSIATSKLVATDVVLEEGGAIINPLGGNKSVLELLLSVNPDKPEGCDQVEQLCRSCSTDGRAFLVASDRNAGSGGYTEYIFKYAAQELYNIDLWSMTLPYKEGRNPDIAEIDINTVLLHNPAEDGNDSNNGSGSIKKLKFARAYGFRNIQSVMLKVRRGQCEYDFIEIMACPSGCNNGGGQIRQAGSGGGGGIGEEGGGQRETPTQSRERVAQVEGTFHRALQVRRPEDNPLVQFLYATSRSNIEKEQHSHAAGGLVAPLSESARRLLHTRYHAVPKLEVIAPLAAKW